MLVNVLLGMTIFVVAVAVAAADIWAFEMFSAFRSSEFL